jgi:ABC-type uncharacterized transport system permease subunit
MKNTTKKLAKFKQWILSIVIGFFNLSLVGFLIISASFGIFGETEMWSWQMWCKIIGLSIGGSVLIQHGKNCR